MIEDIYKSMPDVRFRSSRLEGTPTTRRVIAVARLPGLCGGPLPLRSRPAVPERNRFRSEIGIRRCCV